MKLFSVAFIFASIYYFAHCDDNNAKVGAQKVQWQKYKVDFKKNYDNKKDEMMRFKLFLDTLEDIKGHNIKFEKGEAEVEAKLNEYSDWTYEEKKELVENQ